MTLGANQPRDPDAREQLSQWLTFLRRTLRSWPMLLVSLLIGGVACAVFMHFNAPRFRSETVILYSEKSNSADNSDPADSRAVTLRLKELLMSRPTLEPVIRKFDPYPDVRRTLGTGGAVEELKKHVEFRAPGGDTISIAFDGTSPSQAQGITAELAERVIDSDSGLRKGEARAALDFLSTEKQGTEARLRGAEQELAAFMAQHPRFALDATPLSSGAAVRAALGVAAGSAQSAGGPLRQPTPLTPDLAAAAQPASPRAAGSNDAQNAEALARAAVAAAKQNLAEQLVHYTPAYPGVREAQAALDRANERLAALKSTAPAVEPAPESSGMRPAPSPPVFRQPAAQVVSTAPAAHPDERAKELVELETQWLKLTRAVTEARQRQDQIEGQLFKADIEASSELAGHGVQISVIDPAFLPERPLPPGRTLIAVLFALGSLALGVLVAVVRAVFDDRVFGAQDIAGVCDVLIEIPKASAERRARVPV
jgi:uncharacterized protein involved in exopolysaccharide biosynthesis